MPEYLLPVPELWISARDGETEEVVRILEEDPDVEERGGGRATSPLHEAARGGHVEILLLLLDHGAVVSAQNTSLTTPLHLAALMGRGAVLLLLLDHGADASSKDNFGGTALHSAALAGQRETARLLLHRGADLQSKTNDGRTPEDMATARSHPQIPNSHRQVAEMLRAEAVRREAVRRAQFEAFAMGHQERLGAGSRVRWLDAEVVRMVLEQF